MSNNMDNAISNLLTRAKNAASTATAEELVYLAKAIEAVAPGESINFLMQAAEDEVTTISNTGTTKVNDVNSAGTTKVNAVNSAGTTQVNAVNTAGANQVAALLASGGSTGGLLNVQIFENSSDHRDGGSYTWTKSSSDVKKIRIQMVGAGGGSAGHGENAGSGGYCEKLMDVTGINSASLTVGTGGHGRNWGQNGDGGGSSSFGSYCSAGGGQGGHHSGHRGGHGGKGSGGDINARGGSGSGHRANGGTQGAASYFGGGAPGIHTSSVTHVGAPGAGGGGTHTSHNSHQERRHGRAGIVIVWEYGAG